MADEFKLALDKASVRSYDGDGRLHLSRVPLSKANVCPYLGKEIPGSEEMGLDPDKVYRLFRDPEELRKAAPTSNNMQLLYRHKPVSAADPSKELTVGSTGTDAEFEAPYLYNSLVVWDKEAIDGIESDKKKELSAGYYYRADMTPGTYEGEAYDGVMRDIRFNHEALVVEGRAGSDVVVGDSMENLNMSKKQHLSRLAAMVKGALVVSLKPRLAQDAKLDLDALLVGVSATNWKASKARIVKAVGAPSNAKLFKDKLAQDEATKEAGAVLDSIDSEDLSSNPDRNEDGAKDSPNEALLALLEGKVDDATLAKVKAVLEGGSATDDDMEDTELDAEAVDLLHQILAKLNGGAATDKEPGDIDITAQAEPVKPEVTKAGMDAAIAKAVALARRSAVKDLADLKEAEEIVRPHVGRVSGMESAEAVYRLALDSAGVELEGVPPAAFKAMVKLLPKPGDLTNDGPRRPSMATDAATVKSFAELFPEAGKIRQL